MFCANDFGDGAAVPLETSDVGSQGSIQALESGPSSGIELDTAESSGLPSAGSRGPSRESGPTWPSGRTPDSNALTIDPVEVRVVADYGPAPTHLFAELVYAIRVLQRRRDLRARVRQLASAFEAAERARDELLVSAIQELRGKVLLVEGGDELFAPVLEIERLALERRSALAGTNAERDRRAEALDAGADALRKTADQKRAVQSSAGAELDRQRELFERAAAKKKRLYIEIRAILDAAEKTGGRLSPAQEARVAELEAAVRTHNPVVDELASSVKRAEAALAAAEAAVRYVERQLAEARRQRRALDEEFQTQIGTRREGVVESERQRAAALAEIMRRVLESRGRWVDVPREMLDTIRRADDTLAARAMELEKFVRALDSHDDRAYRRGLAVGAAGIIVLIVAIVASFLL